MARVKNVSGEEIPAWAIMLVTGIERNTNENPVLMVNKVAIPPTTTGRQRLLINGATPIDITGDEQYGHGTEPGSYQWVGYNTSQTPAFGSMWGVANGQWYLQKDEPGWVIDGLKDANKERVLASFTADMAFYFVLSENLTAPSGNLLAGATAATAQATIYTNSNSGSLAGGVNVTLTNRWSDLELDAGKGGWCQWDWTLMEWVIVTTECPD